VQCWFYYDATKPGVIENWICEGADCLKPALSSGVTSLQFVVVSARSKIGSYPELDPYSIIHILCFITPNFLPIFVMIIVALAIFQAWIWVAVSIGKFLNGLGVRNIFNTKLPGLGAC